MVTARGYFLLLTDCKYHVCSALQSHCDFEMKSVALVSNAAYFCHLHSAGTTNMSAQRTKTNIGIRDFVVSAAVVGNSLSTEVRLSSSMKCTLKLVQI